MNKVVNIFSGIVLIIYIIFTMMLVYDLSYAWATLKGIPFQIEICTGFALLIFLLGVLRIKRKWQGARDMRNFKQFVFVRPVALTALRRSLLHTISEAIFLIVAAAVLTKIALLSPAHTLPMIVVLCLLFVEMVIFAVHISKASDAYRIGINRKAVAYFNREMHLFYYTGLRRIEIYQDTINFQYKDELNILLPLEIIRPEDRAAFRDALIETIENHVNDGKRKNIYIDDAFRTLE